MSAGPVWFSSVDELSWLQAARTHASLKAAIASLGLGKPYSAVWTHLNNHLFSLKIEMEKLLGTDTLEKSPVFCVSKCGGLARAQKRGSDHGLCANCYERRRLGNPYGPGAERPRCKGKQCVVADCSAYQYAKELCNLHYQRARWHGVVRGERRYRTTSNNTRARERVPTSTKTCDQCGKDFTLATNYKEQRFCGRVCKGVASRKIVYPADEKIIAWFKELHSIGLVASKLGVQRGSLASFISRRPFLKDAVQDYRAFTKLIPEEAARRAKEAKRKYGVRMQQENPERRRESNRKWARNQDPGKRSFWNHHNRVRRTGSLKVLTAQERRATFEYEQMIRKDPCVHCGARAVNTIDHIRPVHSGGSNRWDNKAPSCWSCNSSKGSIELLQFMLRGVMSNDQV